MSQSFYGTSDQGGNVIEWNEALQSNLFRGLWGGMFGGNAEVALQLSFRNRELPSLENVDVGFRVAAVPEPSTLALAAFGVLGLLTVARRNR